MMSHHLHMFYNFFGSLQILLLVIDLRTCRSAANRPETPSFVCHACQAASYSNNSDETFKRPNKPNTILVACMHVFVVSILLLLGNTINKHILTPWTGCILMTVQRIERVFFASTCHILFRHVGSPLVVDNNNVNGAMTFYV